MIPAGQDQHACKMSILQRLLQEEKKAVVVLVEHVKELVSLQTDFLTEVGPLHNYNCVFLDGHVNLKVEGQQWTAAISNQCVVATTAVSFVHAVVHGHVKLESVSLLVVLSQIPETPNQHALCSFMDLFYWPLLGEHFRDNNSGDTLAFRVVGFVEEPEAGEDVFKRHQWNMKYCHYRQFFDAHIISNSEINLLQPANRSINMEGRIVFEMSNNSIGDYDANICTIENVDYNSGKQITITNANGRFIAEFMDKYIKTHGIREECIFDPIPTCARRLGRAIDALYRRRQHYIVTKLGALLEPTFSVDILSQFCACLAKTSGEKFNIKTVSVRRVDGQGRAIDQLIVPTVNDSAVDEIPWFASQISLPSSLKVYGNIMVCGPPAASRHDARALAAFKVCRQLLSKGLLDDHLHIDDSLMGTTTSVLGDSSEEEEDLEIEEEGEAGGEEVELVPKAFQGLRDEWIGRHLYVLEWKWSNFDTNDQPSNTLTKWLSITVDYMNTVNGPIGFGLVLQEEIPAHCLPDIHIPTGAFDGTDEGDHEGFVCRLRHVKEITLAEHHKLMTLQPLLFSFLNVRPLFLDELLESENGEKVDLTERPWIGADQRVMYMIAPLKRVGFEYADVFEGVDAAHERFEQMKNGVYSSSIESFYDTEWMIDFDFDSVVSNQEHSEQTVTKLLETINEKYGNDADYDVFMEYFCKSCLLFTPYNGMFYRFRRLYDNLTPSSPFESKVVPEATTYWEYTKLRYPIVVNEMTISEELLTSKPMLAVSRVENFADISTWTLADENGFETTKMANDRKRLKLCSEGVEQEKKSKTALIPFLCRVSRVPYAVIRALLVVPRVVSELESLLLCLDYYNGQNVRVMEKEEAEILASSLTAVTAMQPYNYERLEVLGDSLLKAAVTVDVMMMNGRLNEGRLSLLRQSKINNAALFKLGRHQLQIYRFARLFLFTPKLWTPPSLPVLIDRDQKPVEWAQAQRLFDPSTRIALLKEAERKRIGRDTIHLYDVHRQQIIFTDADTEKHSFVLSRKGQPVAGKTVADLVEASIGAIYLVGGVEEGLRWMRGVGLIDLEGDLVEDPLGAMGRLLVDPADKMPAKSAFVEPLDHNQISPDSHDLEALILDTLDYKFKHPQLLVTAFTHSTIDPTHCNERLEWLGDAILDWHVTRHLYTHCPWMSPYDLTEARKACVNNVTLAGLTIKLGWHVHLKHGRRESFLEEVEKHLADASAVPPPKSVSDLLEAVIGAVFLDCHGDYDACDAVIAPLLTPILQRFTNTTSKVPVSAISRCLEAYARLGLSSHLRILFTDGTPRLCRVECRGKVVGESVVAQGEGKTGRAKAMAKERAAQSALDYLLSDGRLI